MDKKILKKNSLTIGEPVKPSCIRCSTLKYYPEFGTLPFNEQILGIFYAKRRKNRMKVNVEYLEFMWPMRHFLITCGDIEGKSNIIAVSFCMPVSKEPPLIACAIGKNFYSCELIRSNKEFIVNVPPMELKAKIYYCGFHSGYKVDKFKETGLTPQPARKVRAPIFPECMAHMECKVRQEIETGDKILFIGEVLEAYADEAVEKGERKIEYAKGNFPRKVYTTRFRRV